MTSTMIDFQRKKPLLLRILKQIDHDIRTRTAKLFYDRSLDRHRWFIEYKLQEPIYFLSV